MSAEETQEGLPFPVQPLRNQVIVEEVDLVPDSKIIMPDTAKSRLGTRYGRAVAVGPGTVSPFTGEMLPCEVRMGEVVMFGEYAGHAFTHDGEKYKLLQMADVVATVDVARFKPVKKDSVSADSLPALGKDTGKKIVMP